MPVAASVDHAHGSSCEKNKYQIVKFQTSNVTLDSGRHLKSSRFQIFKFSNSEYRPGLMATWNRFGLIANVLSRARGPVILV